MLALYCLSETAVLSTPCHVNTDVNTNVTGLLCLTHTTGVTQRGKALTPATPS